MTGWVVGIATILAMVTFLGICWWAFSRGRADDNRKASMLPFAVPDEGEADKTDKTDKKDRSSHE